MVLLTMTAAIVEALESLGRVNTDGIPDALIDTNDESRKGQQTTGRDIPATELTQADERGLGEKNHSRDEEPSLSVPAIGNPISHAQVLELSKRLKARNTPAVTLEVLLKGSQVYIPPPAVKREPTSEYKALMARLRREEEIRSYERMTNPLPPAETFNQRFPAASAAHAFSSAQDAVTSTGEDELTYADIDRQMALIFNVIVSIVACAGGLWMVARWWSTPARLALSMFGSILVGVAEVVVYMGYIRRISEAKSQAKKLVEVKEVVNSWVVGGQDDPGDATIDATVEGGTPINIKEMLSDATVRRRKKDLT